MSKKENISTETPLQELGSNSPQVKQNLVTQDTSVSPHDRGFNEQDPNPEIAMNTSPSYNIPKEDTKDKSNEISQTQEFSIEEIKVLQDKASWLEAQMKLLQPQLQQVYEKNQQQAREIK